MRKGILSLLLILGIISLSACGGSSENLVETSAGNISKDDLYEMMKDRYGEQTLHELVFEKILSDKYEVSDDEVNTALEQLRAQFGEALDEQYSEEELTRLARFQVLQEKAVTSSMTVSEDEMKEYYAEIQPELNARHILVEDKALATDLKKQLDDGADFAKLAEENSVDPGSVDEGGDLGWFDPSRMVPEFSEAVLKLDVDEISKPIKTDNGWHIIQLLEKKDKEPFEDLKAEIEHTMKLSQIDTELVQSTMERELKEAKVKVNDKSFKDTFAQFEKDNKGDEDGEKEK